MATTDEKVLFNSVFEDSQIPAELKWLNQPKKFKCQADGTSGIRIYNDDKSDFWQRTFYEPLLQVDSGHVLYYTVTEPKVVMETTFELTTANKFDQAGLMIYLDSDHWIKTGIEFVDGAFTMGCVVTNVYSDWSCQKWVGPSLSIRLWKIGDSYVVEHKDATSDLWSFVRIAHLDHAGASGKEVKMGIFAASPTAAGASALFKYMNLKTTSGFHHSN